MPLSILLVKVGNVCMTDETSTTVQWTFFSGTSTVGSRTSKEQQARTLETVTTKRTSQIIDGLADGYLGTKRKKPNCRMALGLPGCRHSLRRKLQYLPGPGSLGT